MQDIIRETENLLTNPAAYESMTNGSNVFGDGHAAEHITRILEEKLTPSARARASKPRIAAFDLMH